MARVRGCGRVAAVRGLRTLEVGRRVEEEARTWHSKCSRSMYIAGQQRKLAPFSYGTRTPNSCMYVVSTAGVHGAIGHDPLVSGKAHLVVGGVGVRCEAAEQRAALHQSRRARLRGEAL
eukprot:scaffold8178_cov48-Phaeocystis_antarctica.AAC.2